jgi:hypothetical protein
LYAIILVRYYSCCFIGISKMDVADMKNAVYFGQLEKLLNFFITEMTCLIIVHFRFLSQMP